MARCTPLNYPLRSAACCGQSKDCAMRIDAARIAIMLCLLASGLAAQETLLQEPPDVPEGVPLTEYARQHQAFFSKVGTGKGTGYRQYKRREEFIKPRNYPSGEPINFTALSFAH